MAQLVIYPKQAASITGNSYEAGKRLLQRIRARLHKDARAYVSITEFCQYTGLPLHEVQAALRTAA